MRARDMQIILDRYLEAVRQLDADDATALMAENVSVEDPVGGPPGTHVIGRDAVRSFFRKGFERSRPCPRRTGPIRTTLGQEAAMPFLLELDLNGVRSELDVIDVVTFNEAGEIESLRAFWDLRSARAVPSESQGP